MICSSLVSCLCDSLYRPNTSTLHLTLSISYRWSSLTRRFVQRAPAGAPGAGERGRGGGEVRSAWVHGGGVVTDQFGSSTHPEQLPPAHSSSPAPALEPQREGWQQPTEQLARQSSRVIRRNGTRRDATCVSPVFVLCFELHWPSSTIMALLWCPPAVLQAALLLVWTTYSCQAISNYGEYSGLLLFTASFRWMS